jgi:GT2 family glycosyltransferase
MSPLPPTSLIICSRNRPAFLVDLVASILAGETLPSEIIVVDDSDSRNETLLGMAASAGCELRYLWNRSTGLSRANNVGIRLARHDILVFTQDDVLVARDWLANLVGALLVAGPQTVVTGQVRPGVAERPGSFAPSTTREEKAVLYSGRIGKDVLYLQNMAMRREVADALGDFDGDLGPGTAFPSAEDNDFAYRLLEAGYQILYAPQAVTTHRAWRTADDRLTVEWHYGLGQGAFYAKHMHWRDRYMVRRMARDIWQYAIRFPFRLCLRPRQAKADALFVGGLLVGAVQWTYMKRVARP